jgi:hypothetical protein
MKIMVNHGSICVDSGSVVILPKSEVAHWRDSEFIDVREYEDKNGRIFSYREDFHNFNEVIDIGGAWAKPNDLLASGQWSQVNTLIPVEDLDLSYNSVCQTTLGRVIKDQYHGFIKKCFAMSTGGDGFFEIEQRGNLFSFPIWNMGPFAEPFEVTSDFVIEADEPIIVCDPVFLPGDEDFHITISWKKAGRMRVVGTRDEVFIELGV